MGETIGPVVAKAAIEIDPEEWAKKPVDIILAGIVWRRDEAVSLARKGPGNYKDALKRQRLLREAVVLANLLPPLRVVGD